MKIYANERWREHNEQQRNVYENYAEEQRDGKEANKAQKGGMK